MTSEAKSPSGIAPTGRGHRARAAVKRYRQPLEAAFARRAQYRITSSPPRFGRAVTGPTRPSATLADDGCERAPRQGRYRSLAVSASTARSTSAARV
jgi:hypothetical protein